MKGSEKVRAALSKQGTPEIPAVIPYEGIFIRDHWDDLISFPWWYQFAPEIDRQLLWRREAAEGTGQDWFRLPAHYPDREREQLRIERRGDRFLLVHTQEHTERELVRPRVSGWEAGGYLHSRKPRHLARTKEEIDRLVPDPGEGVAGRFIEEGGDALAQRLLETFNGGLFPVVHTSSPLWRCYQLWGFEGMMLLIAREPDLVRYTCERYLDLAVWEVQTAAAMGAEGVWIEECMTDMIGPDSFREINVPLITGLGDAIKSCGMKSIYYFCGDPTHRMEMIISCGTDAVSFEESKKGFRIDVHDVVEAVGARCTVLGNLDAIGVLEKGAEDALRREIQRQLEAGRRNGGRFIMSLGSPVTPGTPVERVRLYCEMVHELGMV